jgi:hypothetical protein
MFKNKKILQYPLLNQPERFFFPFCLLEVEEKKRLKNSGGG